jgi:splicing suppressor protein 51
MLGFGKKKDEAAPVDDYAVSQEEKDKLIEWVHQRERLPPMVESPIPVLKQLGEQYARASKGCVRCTAERMSFNCPTSGFPSHCSKECWDSDEAHRRIAKDLRQVHQDHVDLRSGASPAPPQIPARPAQARAESAGGALAGRKFREFIFPGPPDFSRMIDLNNWRAFLEDREFRTCIDLRVGDARSADQQELEALSTRHVSSVFTFPLTIAHAIFWQRAMGDPARLKKKDEDGKEIPRRITIVGARAEARSPPRPSPPRPHPATRPPAR